jgi:hypothetical protein
VRSLIREEVTHTFGHFLHTNQAINTPSDLLFYPLSTDISPSYYYYLYIQETLPQTNPSAFRLILNTRSGDASPRDISNKTEKMRMRAAA